jgi:FkbM family methyltransferase
MHPLLKLAAKTVPDSLKQRFKEDLTRYFQAPSMELSLKNMRRLGFSPTTIIDIGAHIGEWSCLANNIFPAASILMIEAQENKAPALDQLVQGHPGKIQRRIALLGPENRDGVPFNECDTAPTGSSVLAFTSPEPLKFHVVRRRMETLDSVLANVGLARPNFLKLDVQGFELEILKGAPNALAAAEAVLLEVSTIAQYEAAPLFHEVVAFMNSRGYHVFDICTLMRQRTENTLVQMDVIFVKADSPLFAKAIEQL